MQRKPVPAKAKPTTKPDANVAKKAPLPKEPQNTGLPKEWKEVEKNVFLCPGFYSQAHKRFKGHNQQSAATCIVACAYAALRKMNTWTRDVLDQILHVGTDLHLRSKQLSSNRCLEHMKPSQIYNYFFLGNLKISMRIGVDTTSARISRDSTMLQKIEDMLKEFFTTHPSGIVACVHSYFAIWKTDRYVFIFDPTEHNLEGGKWSGLPGMGYCYCIRSTNTKILADVVMKNSLLKPVNRYTIYPCGLDKYIEINTKPPETLGEIKPIPLEVSKTVKKSVLPSPKIVVKKAVEVAPTTVPVQAKPPQSAEDVRGSKTQQVKPKKEISKSMIPPERPKLQSATNFAELLQGRMGILRASTHQRDPKFTRYLGKQSVGNAIAALTMLRQYKAKQWLRNILDDVLRLGEHIHHDMKKLPPGEVPKKVTLNEINYAPKVERYGAMGLIESSDNKILDLNQALTNALIDMDCCILNGPNIVAIWKQENKFYMFDPEERNPVGKPVQVGETGVACLTWYAKLADLIAIYLSNLPKDQRKSKFMLCKVAIKDYVPLAEDWFNFKSLTAQKWILRGTINQNDRRFSRESRNAQCTANATMALTYKEMKKEQDWDSQVMDQVLVSGDELYRNCVEYLQQIGKFRHRHLMVDEIKRTFNIEDKKVDLEIDDCLVYGVINAKSDSSILNLRKGFTEFFGENDAGVVTANNLSMAVWKRDDTYYYFDSHCRDYRGIVSGYGTSCTLRLMTIEDLTNAMTVNFGTNDANMFNISRVIVKVLDVTEEGVAVPPLNFYEALSNLIAILRSNTSQKDKKYDISAGKQQVPMCLAALAFNAISPSSGWTKDDLDQVLNLGDKLFSESMAANYAEGVPEELDVDDVTTANVKKQLSIGPNSLEMELEDNSFGNLEENLKEAVESLHTRIQEEGNTVFQTILETQYMTASMWRDDNSLYLFDPYPRDERGQVYGKDDWSVKIEEPPEGEEEEEEHEEDVQEAAKDEQAPEKEDDDEDWVNDNDRDEGAGGDNMGEFEDVSPPPPTSTPADEETQEEDEDYDAQGGEGADEEEEKPLVEKKGSVYWRQKEEAGKACVVRFSRVEDLIQHILDNSPPNQRQEIEYTLKTVKLSNTPVLHEVFDPEEGEKKDEFVGDWNEFKEFDYGRWILRSKKNLRDALFPVGNRGKQAIPMCLVALAFSSIYALSKFNQDVVDAILAYGDRLYTCLWKLRSKELRDNKELGITEEEAEQILKCSKFEVEDYPKNICMGEKRTKWESQLEVVTGDITSQIPETVPNVTSGLGTFFESNAFGILTCRDYPVAVFTNEGMYCMFDPHATGPSGTKSPIGVSCITRFKELDHLAQTFLSNLPRIGNNFFVIHAFTFSKEECVRPRQPEEKVEQTSTAGGFKEITAGKSILRSNVKLDCTKFDRGVHIHSAPIAFVALALSLNKDPDTWTRLMVNEILTVAEELYNDTLEKLGEKFDSWGKQLDICKVKTDFMLGRLKVNVAIRFTEQKGILDIKNSKTPNLRQGIERFFEENTHGVLVADKFIMALWEQQKGKDVSIYLYDPNSRGGTGLPGQGGVSCLMKFCNAKMAADHIMACMMDIDKTKTEFTIVPVEIVVGSVRTKRKVCKGVSKEQKPEPKSSTRRPCCDPNLQYAKAQHPAVPASVTVRRPATSAKPMTCPDKTTVLEQKRKLRQIAADERDKEERRRCELLGRAQMYEITSNQSIIRGLRYIVQDKDLPVNLVAFVFMKISVDLTKWTYKQIELILEAGYQLYVDSYNAYKPDTSKLGIQHVLRRILLKDHEAKFEIKKPIRGNRLTRENLNTHLTNFFMITNFCIVSFDEYLVSVYFKSGYYYLFDPYSRDLFGNKAEDGSAMLMRFGDLTELVDKVVKNLQPSENEVTEKRYALIVVSLTSVTPIAK